MDEVSREALRRRSSALFGNRYLAEVVMAVVDLTSAGEPAITVRMIASHTALTDSLVRPIVKRLVDAHLLHPLPQERLRGASFHEVRHGDGLWDALVGACRVLHERAHAT